MLTTGKFCLNWTSIFFIISVFDSFSRGSPRRPRQDDGDGDVINSFGLFTEEDPEWHFLGCDFPSIRGYDCEEHKVETKDGYILTVHRIPRGRNNNCTDYNKVLILQHGFLGSSTNFMINSRKESLGYLFADDCYDVWIPNSRGNIYSLEHNTYTSDDEEFWKFSFDEMAQYDLPAYIEYILKATSQKSFYYIGHSQGTMIAFMAFSENKELAKKVRFLGMLAPVGYASHMTSGGSYYSAMSDQVIYMTFGRKSLFGSSVVRNDLVEMLCISRRACVDIGDFVGGKFGPNMNTSRLAVYYTHTPAGSSVQNFVHWAQLMRSEESRKFDFGSKSENIAHYGTAKPPKIQLDKVDLPVAIFSGGSDTLADPIDVERLIEELPNVITKVKIEDYSHLDFIWAMDSREKLFIPLSYLMKYI